MKKEDVVKEIKSLSWSDLRTYCKDSNIPVKGKTKEELIDAAIEVRWAGLTTLKQNTEESTAIYGYGTDKGKTSTDIMGRMITCQVQNLNPAETKLPNKLITIGNMQQGFELPSYVVEFNKEIRIPAGIVNYLQTTLYRTSVQVKNKEGVMVTENILKKAYHVTIIPTISAKK